MFLIVSMLFIPLTLLWVFVRLAPGRFLVGALRFPRSGLRLLALRFGRLRGLVSVAFRLVPLLVHRSSARSVPKSRLLPNRIPDDGPDLLTSCFDAPKSVLRACLALFRTN